jgi:hypothetical protein
MKYIVIILITFLLGCGRVTRLGTYCHIEDVDKVKCVLCTSSSSGVAVSCDWRKK